MAAKRSTAVPLATVPKNRDEAKEYARKAFANASRYLNESGYGVKSKVSVAIDPKLPFMGYSMPVENGYRVVVSGGSLGSGMLEGLIVHEMSHIYRMENNHPSHDAEVIEQAIGDVVKRERLVDYQQKIVHDLLNDIQDLYADDISMKVMKNAKILEPGQMSSFLQDWVKEDTVETGDPKQDRWINASIMVHNARALGQMTRHGIEDTDGKAEEANRKFLSQMPAKASEQFEYFRKLMINLRENMTRDEYRKLLSDYLSRFLEIAEKN